MLYFTVVCSLSGLVSFEVVKYNLEISSNGLTEKY